MKKTRTFQLLQKKRTRRAFVDPLMWNVPNVGLASLHLASFSRLICNPLPKDSTLPNIRTEKNSDRSHPNFSSSNPFVPSKRRTYRLTNYPIEFICIKRDTRLYHAPLCKFILIFVTRHRPFPFSPSPSFPLSPPLDSSITRIKVQKLSVVLSGERGRGRGRSSFSGVLLKSRQRGEKNAGRERRGEHKNAGFFRSSMAQARSNGMEQKDTAGVEIMTLSATRNFAGAA